MLFAAITLSALILAATASATAADDERINGLQEQIRTLENVTNGSTNAGEKARLESKKQRLQQELAILQERQAIEAQQKTLTADLQRNTADTLREKLRAVDRSVDEGETRIRDLNTRRKLVSDEREVLAGTVETLRSKATVTADGLAEAEEQLYTKNEEMRMLALQLESADMDIELARDADRLREQLKQFDPHQRASLRSIVDSYGRWRDARKISDQVQGLSGDLSRTIKVTQGEFDLAQQKLAKYDEELALLEKQVGFFNSDAKVQRLIANQRTQKKALGLRLPLISEQVEALQRTQQSLQLRQDLLKLGSELQREQLVSLEDSYYQRLRWPVLVLAGLLLLYVVASYLVLPLVSKNEDLLISRRLARYATVVLATVSVAAFLFDDLSMVAATLGVVSAALVISLQDVCTSVFGWFVIMLGGKFGVGDRLEVDGARGDVIDITLLRTTLLEINGWLGTDQPTGRVVVLPNNFIFKTKVYNYTHGHPYIWGKIDVTVTYGTPVASAMAMFEKVLGEETSAEFAAAQHASNTMKKRYGIEDAKYIPKIYTTLADSGVTFSLFYVAHYKNFSATRNRINRRLIAELETRPHIQLAYHTVSLLHGQSAPGAPSAILGSETTPPFPATATTIAPGDATDLIASKVVVPPISVARAP